MKRSEMVKQISEIINRHDKNGYKLSIFTRANTILSSIEYSGMLPPLRKVKFDGTDGKKHTTLQRSWESEDD